MCHPIPHYLKSQNQDRKTYKSGISDFSSLSQPKEPEILKGDQLLLQQFPAPAEFSTQDHFSFECIWQLTFILLYHTEANLSFTDVEECWSWDIFRCHDNSKKSYLFDVCWELRFVFKGKLLSYIATAAEVKSTCFFRTNLFQSSVEEHTKLLLPSHATYDQSSPTDKIYIMAGLREKT